jgi:hypothetical protein
MFIISGREAWAAMARTLSGKDRELLRKLAPECTDNACADPGPSFQSVFLPVINHYALDADDFRRRIERLDTEELRYLVSLIIDRQESLVCVPPGYAEAFVIIVAERLGEDAAIPVLDIYGECEICSP